VDVHGGIWGAPLVELLCTPLAGRLRQLIVRGEALDAALVVERLPELAELVELGDHGASPAVVHRIVQRAPNLLSLDLYGAWRHSLGQLSDGQLQQLQFLKVSDSSGECLAEYGTANLAATLSRLVNLRHLYMSGVPLDDSITSALPPSLLGLEVLAGTDEEAARITPTAALLMAGIAALPNVDLLITMVTMRSTALDEACERRGIELQYRRVEEVRALARARLTAAGGVLGALLNIDRRAGAKGGARRDDEG